MALFPFFGATRDSWAETCPLTTQSGAFSCTLALPGALKCMGEVGSKSNYSSDHLQVCQNKIFILLHTQSNCIKNWRFVFAEQEMQSIHIMRSLTKKYR